MLNALDKPRRYLRIIDLRARYGWKTSMSVYRAVRNHLPPPSTYMATSPMWSLDVLDAWDAEKAINRPERKIEPDPAWIEKARKQRLRNLKARKHQSRQIET